MNLDISVIRRAYINCSVLVKRTFAGILLNNLESIYEYDSTISISESQLANAIGSSTRAGIR